MEIRLSSDFQIAKKIPTAYKTKKGIIMNFVCLIHALKNMYTDVIKPTLFFIGILVKHTDESRRSERNM